MAFEPQDTADHGWVPPSELDGFRVVRQLGRGGMGTVYLGHDDVLERPVALKFLAAADPKVSARDRFLLEARAIARLQHPNVVGIYRIGEVLGRPYLAYELVSGRSLDQIPKPVPWPRALELVLGVARLAPLVAAQAAAAEILVSDGARALLGGAVKLAPRGELPGERTKLHAVYTDEA